MDTSNEKHKRLQFIFIALIAITIPCYALGYVFVSVNRRVTTATGPVIRSATYTPSPLQTSTPIQVIPTRFPTFTPSLTPSITPTLTPSLTPSDTPSPSWTPEPTESLTPSPTSTNTFPAPIPPESPASPGTTE